MAFKIKPPFHVEGSVSTINPGKKINLTKKDSPDFAKSGVGSKVITYQQYRDSGGVPKGMESVFSGKGTLRVSKSYTGKKSSGQGEGAGQGNIPSTKSKPVTKTKPVVEVKSKRKPREKVKAVDKVKSIGVKTGDYSKGVKNKKGVVKGLDVKATEISTKKPTVKVAPKDNSRKAIRQRKKADKAAGVSKSQMRANKAKSKSEAALAKSKATKDNVNKARLKFKADRLAKRAARKGGSPVKAVGDPKDPKDPKKQTKKENTKKILSSTPSGGTSATSDKIMQSYQKKKINAKQMEQQMKIAQKLQRKKDSIMITNSKNLFERSDSGKLIRKK